MKNILGIQNKSNTNPTILTQAPAPIGIRAAFCRMDFLKTRLQKLQLIAQTAQTIQGATLSLLLSNGSVDRSQTSLYCLLGPWWCFSKEYLQSYDVF